MADSKKYNGSTWEHSLRKLATATDTFTTLPADIYADGNNGTVGISGNTTQSGTPTPGNPIMPEGCGERTRNLFDGDYTVAVMSVSGNTATLNTTSSGRTAIVKCEPNTTYAVKKYSVSNRFIIAESDIKPVNGTAMSIIQNDSSKSEYSFTTSNTTQYVAVYCSTSSEQAAPQLMFNTGSTAISYEPYGYKIPISSANTTTPVYLGEVQTTRKIKKLVLTGEETIRRDTDSGRSARYYIAISDIESDTTNLLSSHFTVSMWYEFGTMKVYKKNLIFSMDKSQYPEIADFKAYLAAQYAAGTPVTVWYVLATPETAVVNEPLMRIGDYADSLTTSIPVTAGPNSFDVDTTVAPSEVTAGFEGWHPVQSVHERENGQWD